MQDDPDIADDLTMMLGYQYHSAAILSEHLAQPSIASLAFPARPGMRAPHCWVQQEGQRRSTLDLFGQTFTLLAGADGSAWVDAAQALAAHTGFPFQAYRVGDRQADLLESQQEWEARYGVSAEGAVLVRPDGFIAWRTSDFQLFGQSPELVLQQAFSRLLGWESQT